MRLQQYHVRLFWRSVFLVRIAGLAGWHNVAQRVWATSRQRDDMILLQRLIGLSTIGTCLIVVNKQLAPFRLSKSMRKAPLYCLSLMLISAHPVSVVYTPSLRGRSYLVSVLRIVSSGIVTAFFANMLPMCFAISLKCSLSLLWVILLPLNDTLTSTNTTLRLQTRRAIFVRREIIQCPRIRDAAFCATNGYGFGLRISHEKIIPWLTK